MTNTSFNLQNGIFLPFSPEATGVGIPGQFTTWSTDNAIGPAGTPSGSLLDQLTGFSALGFMQRTGAGAYSFSSVLPNSALPSIATFGAPSATWPTTYSMPLGGLFPVTAIDPVGEVGLYVAGRSSDWNTNTATTNSIPFALLSVHDRSVTSPQPTGVWGAYWQFNKTAGASTLQQHGVEMSFQNLGSSVATDPYSAQPVVGGTNLMTLDSGIGAMTGNPVTSAIRILNNGNTFNAGILFGVNSLTSGENAIQMPTGYGITWFSGTVGAGVAGVKLAASSSAANLAIYNGTASVGTQTPNAGATLTVNGGDNTSATYAAVFNKQSGAAIFYLRSDGFIFHAGTAIPSVTNSFALGTSSLVWSNVFSTAYSVGSNQVVGARQTGWAAATNTKSKATFDTTTVTLPQLAARVGQLIDDLTTHGLIGA